MKKTDIDYFSELRKISLRFLTLLGRQVGVVIKILVAHRRAVKYQPDHEKFTTFSLAQFDRALSPSQHFAFGRR
jgi:hypothetical protein